METYQNVRRSLQDCSNIQTYQNFQKTRRPLLPYYTGIVKFYTDVDDM